MLGRQVVTGSAFTQARYKIRHEFFRELAQKSIAHCEAAKTKLWKGHRLLGADGSTLNLPISRDIVSHFGVFSTTELGLRTCLARVLFLYDILNDVIVNGEISPISTGEKSLLKKSLPSNNNRKDIYILDRGFGHYCTIVECLMQRKFCVRISENSRFARGLMAKKGNDIITTWQPSPRERENANKNKIACIPLTVRVVKVKLKSGETQLIVSNLLNQNFYSTSDIRQLYHHRWGIEEGFKKFKPKMKVEQFGCKKAHGIYQEFYAHIFCFNMIALVGLAANTLVHHKTRFRKRRYKFNWQNAFRFLRNKIVHFLSSINQISQTFHQLIQQILNSIIAIVPGRSFVRDLRLKHKQRGVNPFHK